MTGACGVGCMVEPDAELTAAAGFSVSDHRCSAANLSFAHEIGHNLGMDPTGTSSPPPTPTPSTSATYPSRIAAAR